MAPVAGSAPVGDCPRAISWPIGQLGVCAVFAIRAMGSAATCKQSAGQVRPAESQTRSKT